MRDKIHQFTVSVRMVVVCRLVARYSHGTGLKGVEETALLQIEPVYFRTVRAGQKKVYLSAQYITEQQATRTNIARMSLMLPILAWLPQNTDHRKGNGRKSLVQTSECVFCSRSHAESGTQHSDRYGGTPAAIQYTTLQMSMQINTSTLRWCI